jgi:integrase
MKGGAPHLIPLATQAKSLVETLKGFTGNGRFVFPSARSELRPMSENTIRVALRSIDVDAVPHGFRATARTMLDEIHEVPIEHIEHQLAHSVRDPNGRAYNRTRHLKQRAEMMQLWADYLDELRSLR